MDEASQAMTDEQINALLRERFPELDRDNRGDFGDMPDRLAARGDRGWLDDQDRSSDAPRMIKELSDRLDSLSAEWIKGAKASEHVATQFTALWVELRRLQREG